MKDLKHSMNKGFTSVEVLLSLWIISFSMLLLSSVLPSISKLTESDSFIQEQIGLRQLRHILLLSENVYIADDSLIGWLFNEEYELKYDRNRLVKTPGYEIMLIDLASASFIAKGECIYLAYQKNNETKNKERLLFCKQKGMDFTLFPDDDAVDSFDDPADEYSDQDNETTKE